MTVAPAPMTMAPTPVTAAPAPMAVMPVMSPPHFLGLEAIDLVAGGYGGTGIFIGGKPSALIKRLRDKRCGLRAHGQRGGGPRSSKSNGEFQKIPAFHDISSSIEVMERVSLERDECSLNCAFSFSGRRWPLRLVDVTCRLRRKLLRQHKGLARARDIRPVAVEVGDQPLHVLALHRALERGFVRELICRLMQ